MRGVRLKSTTHVEPGRHGAIEHGMRQKNLEDLEDPPDGVAPDEPWGQRALRGHPIHRYTRWVAREAVIAAPA